MFAAGLVTKPSLPRFVCKIIERRRGPFLASDTKPISESAVRPDAGSIPAGTIQHALGTSFSTTNSVLHFGHVLRAIKIGEATIRLELISQIAGGRDRYRHRGSKWIVGAVLRK